MTPILYIDENVRKARSLMAILAGEFDFVVCEDSRRPFEALRILRPRVVVLVPGPDASGLRETIAYLATEPGIDAVIIPAHHEAARKLVYSGGTQRGQVPGSRGRFHFLKDECIATLKSALRTVLEQIAENSRPSVLHGVSKSVRTVNAMLAKFAASDLAVLVRGESGTGKELAARGIHAGSSRSSSVFVALDCATIPENLFESELFGTERGAYTDAVDRKGAFGEAESGTLFLDEIGNLQPHAQSKLLRVLESKEYRRLGGRRTVATDIRLVSATGTDLDHASKAGVFRLDLLFRINTLVIEIPPLRTRPEDIEFLATDFCLRTSRGQSIPGSSALDKLQSHSWPGNVRELRNVVQRGLVLADGACELTADHMRF